MSTSFTAAEQLLFTSESVTEGHPDKLCDQVSDAVLDEMLRQDPNSRVACETATTTGVVFVLGEITTKGYVDLQKLVREVVRDIGYTDASYGFDYQTCGVIAAIKEQSSEIAQGVDHALEARQGQDPDELGAGDQGMMFGFAVDETPELMPLPIALAHRVAKRLSEVRKKGEAKYLRPDGKSQVTVEYRFGRPARVDKVVVAAQHDPGIAHARLRDDVIERVIRPAVGDLLDDRTTYVVNGTGAFTIGGPMGDAGLTGRKIIVDTYGGYARHGGGAFSGKDATKVDRSASYAARYVAKNVVAAGLAARCEIQVAYVIGVARPVSLNVETFGTGTVPDERIKALIAEHFDFRPGAIIERFGLRRPIYRQTAAYGHFGRTDLDLPWERTDMAERLGAARSPGVATAR
ncbi:MAG: methionine adenosyltransferase [Chloroflexota bacterium]|nr:methionine adenosyltransferase [Chloroflexota bacterium]MDE3192168.1 methionine adenosyltransferase [Chloroflexota bacterium]